VLARDAAQISVGDVISVVEEPLNPVACLDDDAEACTRADNCITQNIWKGLGDRIKGFLNSISVEDLLSELEEASGSAHMCDIQSR